MLSIKKRLQSGNVVVGSWINTASPIVAELMAACGFDFLCVDAEHSAVDLQQIQLLFQAIQAGSQTCQPWVRLHGIDYAFVKRYLDSGATGVVAPLVRDAADIEKLIQATKYPPEGLRGVGYCRANQYGLRLVESVASANTEVIVVAQIEHIDAVQNIDAILAAGVDAIFIGPYDLSASMGITGDFNNIEYKRATKRVVEVCHRHNVAAGIHVVQPDPVEFAARVREGYRLLAYSLDITMLTVACLTGLEQIRKLR